MRSIFLFLSLLLMGSMASAQVTEDVAVELSATTQVSPPQITLKWKRILYDTPTYQIWRKAKNSTSWGVSIVTLPMTDSVYVDNSVVVDSAYEYFVKAVGPLITSAGVIYAGIKAPAIHSRGIMILIVDSTFTVPCEAKIQRFMDDLSGDGWQIIRHDFSRSATDVSIKAVIAADYAAHANVKSVMLLGHVAVPYSGDNNPDGHPDHLGAWPSDVFYASIAGPWSDATVSDPSSSYPANQNIIGDGKYDQTLIPSTTELQVSRIDFANMPAFPSTEVQMMDRYLDKDHVYKMDSMLVLHKALISDNFGYFSGEAFAGNGWRNFPTLVGRDSIQSLPFISTLATSAYQWAYGCGGGSFTSAGGIGTTANFASNPVNGIFTMLFGSYFGDWNVQNNFLRAPLCSNPPALTNCWAGRPHWFFHHMALGENIGYSANISQNNSSTYPLYPNNGANCVHSGLMGDLSLRTDYVKPVLNVTATNISTGGALINWTPSPGTGVIGYYVYRADSAYGYYTRLNATMLAGTTYSDLTPSLGLKYYMVRPVKLQSTPSGGYYNLGVGAIDTLTVTSSLLEVVAVQPSVNITLFPNPAQNSLNVTINTDNACVATMYVVNAQGQVFDMVTKQMKVGSNQYALNVSDLAAGIYQMVVNTGNTRVVKEWVKL